ncbi:MAG TPA: hypothetical protein VMV69_28585 [Pirellulales bacterium]|nr:hypothetical protein [Pirellulales bacterium]
MSICQEIFDVRVERAAIAREHAAVVRYAARELADLNQQIAQASTPCNTARLRELFEAYDVPADVQGQAIADCEGRLPSHCDLVIKILKSQYKKRPRSTPKPDDIMREMTEIGPQLIARHSMNLSRGVHQSAAELRAEIAAEAAGR